MTRKRNLVYGVGINDYPFSIKKNGRVRYSYAKWKSILQRCYDAKFKLTHPSYKDCKVCNEWLFFSNFKKWFDENYIEGYDLDKDILVSGNNIYSPQTCCFVPHHINTLIRKFNYKGKYLPTGISFDKIRNQYKVGGYFLSTQKRFDNIGDAIAYYNESKENYIHKIAKEYFKANKITENVYLALVNYKS